MIEAPGVEKNQRNLKKYKKMKKCLFSDSFEEIKQSRIFFHSKEERAGPVA
jgi:hypothetical protein